MEYLIKKNIPYEEIENGALILLLLREINTWEQLCNRYQYADPMDISTNTTTMTLLNKLYEMRNLGLISFYTEEKHEGRKPVGEIKETGFWTKIRVSFGGVSLSEAAMLSRHSKGMAVVPVFGRPRQPEEKIDVFVLMPFNPKMEDVYTHHIKNLGDELGLSIQRADDNFSPKPFMEKVWDGICSAKLIIADCTQKNPNVFYEIGIAHAVGKKVLLITRSDKDIPSDIKHFEYIHYSYDQEGAEILIGKLRLFLKNELLL